MTIILAQAYLPRHCLYTGSIYLLLRLEIVAKAYMHLCIYHDGISLFFGVGVCDWFLLDHEVTCAS